MFSGNEALDSWRKLRIEVEYVLVLAVRVTLRSLVGIMIYSTGRKR